MATVTQKTTTKVKTTQIGTTRFWAGSQSWNDERIFVLSNGLRIRTQIKRDSHDFQSHATVEVMDGLKWSGISHLNCSLWPRDAQAVNYVRTTETSKSFDALVEILKTDAANILGI
jgi:hypothetical protein